MKTSFTARQLEVLLAVTEAGGFAAAGRLLGISQPAVTKQVRSLESKLGYPLFTVSAGTVPRLTPRGRRFIEVLPDLVQQLHVASGRAAEAQGADAPVRVACGDAIAAQIADCLPALYRAVPGVTLEVRLSDPSVSSAFRLQDGDVDIAYFTMRAQPPPRLGSVIGTVQGRLYVPLHFPPELGMAGHEPLPFISVPETSALSRELEFGLRNVGITNFRIAARMPGAHERCLLALAGVGGVLGMGRKIEELVAQGRLRRAGTGSTQLYRCRFMNPLRSADRHVLRVEQALSALLKEA